MPSGTRPRSQSTPALSVWTTRKARHRAQLGQHDLPGPVGRDEELHPAQVWQRAGLAGQEDDFHVRRELAHVPPLGHVGQTYDDHFRSVPASLIHAAESRRASRPRQSRVRRPHHDCIVIWPAGTVDALPGG